MEIIEEGKRKGLSKQIDQLAKEKSKLDHALRVEQDRYELMEDKVNSVLR